MRSWFSPFPISVASRNQIQVTRLHDKSLYPCSHLGGSGGFWLLVLFIYLFVYLEVGWSS